MARRSGLDALKATFEQGDGQFGESNKGTVAGGKEPREVLPLQ